jgi:hypothetical protein
MFLLSEHVTRQRQSERCSKRKKNTHTHTNHNNRITQFIEIIITCSKSKKPHQVQIAIRCCRLSAKTESSAPTCHIYEFCELFKAYSRLSNLKATRNYHSLRPIKTNFNWMDHTILTLIVQ